MVKYSCNLYHRAPSDLSGEGLSVIANNLGSKQTADTDQDSRALDVKQILHLANSHSAKD